MGITAADKAMRRWLLARWEGGVSLADLAVELAVTESQVWDAVSWAKSEQLRGGPPKAKPPVTAAQAEVRRQALARRQAGEFPWQIAENLGITARQLQDWLRWAERDAGIGHGVRGPLPWLSEEEVAKRQEVLARWRAGESSRQIALDYGVDGRRVKQWLDWAKRKFPDADGEAAPSHRVALRRRRMLEARNAGRPVDWIAKRWGVSVATADNDVKRARLDAADDALGLGLPAEPLLDWLGQLPEDAAGWARHELLSHAETAMGHSVDWRHLLWKLGQSEWRCDDCLYRADDRETGERRFWLTLLSRHRDGQTIAGLAVAYGVRDRDVQAWLRRARDLIGERQKALPRGLKPDWERRRQALELRNRGCSDATIGRVLGVLEHQAGELARGGAAYAAQMSEPSVVAVGPVAEPLRDWPCRLPSDWAGMGKQDFLNRASLAMGYPLYARGVGRRMLDTGWAIQRGRLVRIAVDTVPEPMLQAVA